MTSLSLRVSSARRDTSSIRSALVIGFAPESDVYAGHEVVPATYI
jgi:hypothetical protein